MDSMSAVYQRHAQTVYKFLLSLCHDPDLAEELTQETFYQAVRSADRFDGRCKVSVWLCQIARHLWYGHLRRQGREVPLPEDETMLPPLPSAEEEHLERWSHLELLRQVHALPEPGAGGGLPAGVRLPELSGDRRAAGPDGNMGQGNLLPLQGAAENRR